MAVSGRQYSTGSSLKKSKFPINVSVPEAVESFVAKGAWSAAPILRQICGQDREIAGPPQANN